MICKICEQELNDSIRSISNHIRQKHDITYKEYYDKFLKLEHEGLCKVCNKETSWRRTRYLTYCSTKCACIDTKEQRENTMLNKYGSKSYLNNITKEERIKNNKIIGFGTERFKNTMKNKYGKESYLSLFSHQEHIDYGKLAHNEESYLKRKNTCLEKYGVEHPSQIADFRKNCSKKYIFDNKTFDSSWELAYYIWLKDNNIQFEYQPDISFDYYYKEKLHKYFPDFKVENNFIEIKGKQFFKDKDTNCIMINPFDRTMDELYEAKHQCMKNNNVKIITDCSKYIDYVNEKYTKDFIPLFKNDLEFPYINYDLHDTSDMGLIHHFHKSIYEANRKGKPSPFTAWNDKQLIYKCALNRLKYVGSCKPSDILQGFNVTKIAAKISVFKPSLAESLIKKYIPEADIIIDPFSGFSGRMLGSFNCNKLYIGFDINEKHVQESNEIIEYKVISDMCKVSVQDILNANNTDWNHLKDVCLFTCPPYGGKECWNKDNDEIEKSCDEWIDICIEKHKCQKYLFVVDETVKYKDYIVEKLENKSHFGTNYEYVVLI